MEDDFDIMKIHEEKPDKEKAVRQMLNREHLSDTEMDELLLE